MEPAELTQKTPRVDPAADAEAVFWDIKIEDSVSPEGDLSLSMIHYIRIKIFTDRGKENYATVEIPERRKRSILDLAGRTIKADGSIVELKKDAIFDRELVKTKGLNLRGKAFTLPNVAVGDMIEYRYREVRDNEIASHMRLYYQRELPLWTVTYHVKPLNVPWLPFGMRSYSFQMKNPSFQKEPNGYYGVTMENMPAFQEEPNMPPEDQLRAWMLIYYEEDKKIDPEKYWKEVGKHDFEQYKQVIKVDDLTKKTAAEITSAAQRPDDKLAALELFCRTKIRNLGSSAFQVTAEERKALKENKTTSDTLRQKAGYGKEINLLFVALANAAGFDARMARMSDRGDTFFKKSIPMTYFLSAFSVAVKVNNKWTFFDPSTPYLEPGMLRWQEEGGLALISDPKEGFFEETQHSDETHTLRKRRARLQLHEDGSLEGTVEYTYTGHDAASRKSFYDEMTPAQREKEWKDSLVDRLSTAEMSDFEMQEIADSGKPMVVRHKISVPGYATRTGKRLLLQPAFFQRNVNPRFTESHRKWDISFNYAWGEDDEVVVELPEGWKVDNPVPPARAELAGVGAYLGEVFVSPDGKTLTYKRLFDWGRENKLMYPPASYASLKKIFDFVQQQDGYTLALTQTNSGN